MKIALIALQKDGAGGITTTINLAAALREVQRTAKKWGRNF